MQPISQVATLSTCGSQKLLSQPWPASASTPPVGAVFPAADGQGLVLGLPLATGSPLEPAIAAYQLPLAEPAWGASAWKGPFVASNAGSRVPFDLPAVPIVIAGGAEGPHVLGNASGDYTMLSSVCSCSRQVGRSVLTFTYPEDDIDDSLSSDFGSDGDGYDAPRAKPLARGRGRKPRSDGDSDYSPGADSRGGPRRPSTATGLVGSDARPHVTLDEITPLFSGTVVEAARTLGVGATYLKKRCRELGVLRWPGRKLKSLQSMEAFLKREVKKEAVMNDPSESEKAAGQLAAACAALREEKIDLESFRIGDLRASMKELRQAIYKIQFRRRHGKKNLRKGCAGTPSATESSDLELSVDEDPRPGDAIACMPRPPT